MTPEQILSPEPDDFFRHAQDSLESARGKEKPDPNTFFAPIAKALEGTLTIASAGYGQDATFSLTLPNIQAGEVKFGRAA